MVFECSARVQRHQQSENQSVRDMLTHLEMKMLIKQMFLSENSLWPI